MKSSRMTTYILIAMLLGIAAGGTIHAVFADAATQKLFASYVSIGSMVFLRLIKMIIAPLSCSRRSSSASATCRTPGRSGASAARRCCGSSAPRWYR